MRKFKGKWEELLFQLDHGGWNRDSVESFDLGYLSELEGAKRRQAIDLLCQRLDHSSSIDHRLLSALGTLGGVEAASSLERALERVRGNRPERFVGQIRDWLRKAKTGRDPRPSPAAKALFAKSWQESAVVREKSRDRAPEDPKVMPQPVGLTWKHRCFELGIFDQDGSLTATLIEKLYSDENLGWFLGDNENSILIVRLSTGQELLREDWNFGDLERIRDQLVHVRDRLKAGRDAALRSAVLLERVPAVLFQYLKGEHGVRISTYIQSSGDGFQFPDLEEGESFYERLAHLQSEFVTKHIATIPAHKILTDIDATLGEVADSIERVRADASSGP